MSEGALAALARFASTGGPFSDVALDKARACLLYGLSVAIAARHAPEPAVALRSQSDEPVLPVGAARLLDGARVSAGTAAFANAVLMHARVQEDAHPAGHVGVVVLPAALAFAHSAGVSGRMLLESIAVGYEVALRIGRDHASDLSERGFRTTSVYGPFGAAAACARMAGCDAQQTQHALSLAASTAAGLRAFVEAGSQDFAFQAGWAASAGVRCAALAKAGGTGAASVLDGSAGFFRAFGGQRADHGRRVAESLGQVWEFERVAFKPYPVCQFHRAWITGLLALREQAHGAGLRQLEVRLHPFEADFFGVRHAGPFNSFPQTFMSAPFCAALAWSRGVVSYEPMNDFAAADVLAWVPRVCVISDPARARYQPALRLQTDDGRTLSWQDSEGESAYRLDWAQAEQMCSRLLDEAGVSCSKRQALIEAVARLASVPAIQPLELAVLAAMADNEAGKTSPRHET